MERRKMTTILIVDDEPLLRHAIRHYLESYDFAVVEAASGLEALERLPDVRPDLILLDIMMPGLNGLEVCRALKGDEATAAIPVVLLTGRGGLEDRIQGLNAGAGDYLTKPVEPGELLARVKAQLRTKQLYDELERQQRELIQLLDLAKVVSSSLQASEIFRLIVERTAELVEARRCSLVVMGEEDIGYVVASSDDPNLTQRRIDLARYPEIQEAVRWHEPVVVEDVAQDPRMIEVREVVLALGFRSLLVIPISLRDTVVGTLVLRTARAGQPFTDRELQLCQLIAEIAAVALQNAHLFESLELAKLDLERLTLIDDLTQIYNRRLLFRRLEEEVHRAKRYGVPLSCIMLDVDDFKRVNDQFGHAQGDLVLKELAAVVKGTVRRSDLFARYGGEEFVLLLPMTEGEGAWAEAERIRQTVKVHSFPVIAPHLPLTVSQGIANYPANTITKATDLLELADRALYRAKQAGKDTVVRAWEL